MLINAYLFVEAALGKERGGTSGILAQLSRKEARLRRADEAVARRESPVKLGKARTRRPLVDSAGGLPSAIPRWGVDRDIQPSKENARCVSCSSTMDTRPQDAPWNPASLDSMSRRGETPFRIDFLSFRAVLRQVQLEFQPERTPVLIGGSLLERGCVAVSFAFLADLYNKSCPINGGVREGSGQNGNCPFAPAVRKLVREPSEREQRRLGFLQCRPHLHRMRLPEDGVRPLENAIQLKISFCLTVCIFRIGLCRSSDPSIF